MSQVITAVVRKVARRKNKIREIWIHMNPDIDEIIAVWLIMRFGEERFPGACAATIRLVDPHSVQEDFDTLLEREILVIGFGDGPFNEHAQFGGERLNNASAATLVAEALGIENEPGIEKIIGYALEKDRSSDSRKFELAPLIKTAFRFVPASKKNPEDQECAKDELFAAAFILLEGVLLQEFEFSKCHMDYERSVNAIDIMPPNGKKLRIVSVVSSNPEMHKFCRWSDGGAAGLSIIRKKTGNTQIFFDQRRFDIRTVKEIVFHIRRAERRKRGFTEELSYVDLTVDGRIEGADCWYFEAKKMLILNGSLTNPLPPTALSRIEIEIIVRDALLDYYEYLRS